MLDDCTAKEEQEIFLKGMNAFSAAFQLQNKQFFHNASSFEKLLFLEQLETSKESQKPLVLFYRNAKQQLIQAYTGSEFFMTNIQVYEQIPSRFHGCVPISNNPIKKS
jgi:ureidoglycolate hydrolase